MQKDLKSFIMKKFCKKTFVFLVFFFAFSLHHAEAATLKLSPNTGVYTVGKPFSVTVQLNTDGKSVNAADGQLSFNPRELQVTGVSRGSSIFNLWTEEPKFSNTSGSVSFGGGSPTGYKGGGGNILTITFKALGAGTPKVTFTSGSVLAADGLGTNILSSMNGGSFTITAVADSPAPEYVAPANTPQAPVVTSQTHPDTKLWYKSKTAKLSWNLPSGVTAVRTLLDEHAGSVPTVVYDDLISQKTIEDLDEGVSYFHIQFKNSEGWGKITHYRLGVDSEAPTNFSITEEATSDVASSQILRFTLEDISPIPEYKIQIDGKEPFVYKDEAFAKKYNLEILSPGHHTVIVEAFDSAGNSTAATYSFEIIAFEKPLFTEFPSRINTEVIPAIKGTTRPHALVAIHLTRAEDGTVVDPAYDTFALESNDQGEFVFIPNAPFERGVYVLTARAKDPSGRMSEESDEIRIIVETPGYIVFGEAIINILSVIVPLVALVFLLMFGVWYLWHKLALWRKRVRRETEEAERSLAAEFTVIVKNLHEKIALLKVSRKGKLSQEESELIMQIEADLKHARAKIGKEIEDIEDIVT
jgi:hypothetical protein